ncbi:MAG: lipoyl synthase [Saprospiraceae bacterium]|nr:lipoyl synthase [Saprospiraceae bacterium]
MNIVEITKRERRPEWLKVKLHTGEKFTHVKHTVDHYKLHTICQSGSCPNMGECWSAGTATFMILGNICTRACKFCAVQTGKPTEYDIEEPKRVAEAIKLMGVKHAVITSVNRDELADKGASIWHETVVEIKKLNPNTTIETLIPETRNDWDALTLMISAGQDIVSHNLETVKELYRIIQPQSNYALSLEQLRRIRAFGKKTKSGIMVGLGETQEQVLSLMDDLIAVGCQILTIGQYLQPSKDHYPVKEFVHPDIFAMYKKAGLEKGFEYVESGPLVRSSYHAEKHL